MCPRYQLKTMNFGNRLPFISIKTLTPYCLAFSISCRSPVSSNKSDIKLLVIHTPAAAVKTPIIPYISKTYHLNNPQKAFDSVCPCHCQSSHPHIRLTIDESINLIRCKNCWLSLALEITLSFVMGNWGRTEKSVSSQQVLIPNKQMREDGKKNIE